MFVEKHKQYRKKYIKRRHPVQKQTRAVPLVPKVRVELL